MFSLPFFWTGALCARDASARGGRFAVVTLTDVSEQKRTEEKPRAPNTRLEDYRREIEESTAEPGT
jgi:hypothetical protein